MSSSDLDRLQNDLSTIRAVTGADLPFDRWDVRSTLVTGCCMLLPAVVGAAGVQSRWWLLGSAVPFITSFIITLIHNYRATHPGKACSHEKRREYRIGNLVMFVCVLLLGGFRFWAKRSGAPPDVANGSVLFFLGLLLFIEGLYSSARRAWIAPGIAAIVGGLMWPYCEYFLFWTLLWSCTGVSIIIASVVMQQQLVARERQGDPSY